MSAARAVIADDERLMREQLRARLLEVWPALEIVAEAKNGAEAVEAVRVHRPDLVFLDIRMPGMTGVEAARAIVQLADEADEASAADPANAAPPWPGCEIVFITAYDEYAVEAFEQGAADYVLKPAERERLQVTVERLRKRLVQRASPSEPAVSDAADGDPEPIQRLLQRLTGGLGPASGKPRLRWIQAQVGSTIQMIPVDDVLFFISDEKYTRVQTATVEALIRKPIKELIDELDPEQFWQIHRSTLINAKAIAGISRDMRGRQLVAVKGANDKLEVSRSYTHLFKGM